MSERLFTPSTAAYFTAFQTESSGSSTGGRSRIGQGEFVRRKFEKPFLLGTLPVWVRTALDVIRNDTICFAYRVGTKYAMLPCTAALFSSLPVSRLSDANLGTSDLVIMTKKRPLGLNVT
jgi:hypothetical protein